MDTGQATTRSECLLNTGWSKGFSCVTNELIEWMMTGYVD